MSYVKCIRNLISSTVPDGKTVTPTDDILIWLACGGRSESYTTLSQVLADSTCLSALINDNNAVDYLVRSTTWASDVAADSGAMSAIGGNNYASNTLLADSTWCSAIFNSTYFESVLNVKVPVMTSNTTPSGYVASATYNNTDAYKVFDGDLTTPYGSRKDGSPVDITLKFPSEIKLYKCRIYPMVAPGNVRVRNFNIKGSNDNFTTEETVFSGTYVGESAYNDVVISASVPFDSYKLTVTSEDNENMIINIYEIQYYGRADI